MIRSRFLKLDVKFPYPDVEGLRLTFTLEFMNYSSSDVIIWDIDGIVHASSTSYPKRYYLGRVRTDKVALRIPPNSSISDDVSVDITYDDLERLEKIRDGGRLRFELLLYILFNARLKSPQHIITSTPGVSEFIPIKDYDDGSTLYLVKYALAVEDVKGGTTFFEVSIDYWLDILSRLNFKHVRIIEVPKIKEVANKHLENAVNSLDKAWRLMLEDMEQSLNACRNSLEELKNFLKDFNLLDTQGRIDFKKIYGGESFGEAMDKIFSGLWTLTSVGSHTGRSRMTKRVDMELIITIAYMLLKSVVENVT
jgi:hypothetical protein